jgi:drug/metabolite transporter (DMT)-like permease
MHSLSIIIAIPIITYFYEKENILSVINYLEHKRWFFLRSNINYIGMLFYILSLRFFRCITIQITIISLIPVLFLIGAFFWDRGMISQNLIFGIFCIITGDSLVLYNELKYVNNNGIYYNTVGLIFVFISFTSFASIKIINRKYVNLDNYNLVVHMLYNNILICIYSIIFMPISYLRGINITINFIFLSILSGVFFVVGVFTMALVLKKKQSEEENTTIIIPCKPKLEKKNIIYI